MTSPSPRPALPSLRAVLFDLDGTLIATRRLYVEALADALEPVLGVRWTEDDIMRHKPKAERRFLQELVGPEESAATLTRFYRAYEVRHEVFFQGIYPGVRQVLDRLREGKVPMGLVTGKSRQAWEITAARVQLTAFQVHVFDDDVPAPKPDPAGLRLATEALSVEPEEVIYIGDSLTDLEAAQALGMPSAAVLWSKKSRELDAFQTESRRRGALILQHPRDVLTLLAEG
jgi:pyrophosphatase PpaX